MNSPTFLMALAANATHRGDPISVALAGRSSVPPKAAKTALSPRRHCVAMAVANDITRKIEALAP